MKAHSVAALARGLIMINPTHCIVISVASVVLHHMFFTIGSGLSCELKVAFFHAQYTVSVMLLYITYRISDSTGTEEKN